VNNLLALTLSLSHEGRGEITFDNALPYGKRNS